MYFLGCYALLFKLIFCDCEMTLDISLKESRNLSKYERIVNKSLPIHLLIYLKRAGCFCVVHIQSQWSLMSQNVSAGSSIHQNMSGRNELRKM